MCRRSIITIYTLISLFVMGQSSQVSNKGEYKVRGGLSCHAGADH